MSLAYANPSSEVTAPQHHSAAPTMQHALLRGEATTEDNTPVLDSASNTDDATRHASSEQIGFVEAIDAEEKARQIEKTVTALSLELTVVEARNRQLEQDSARLNDECTTLEEGARRLAKRKDALSQRIQSLHQKNCSLAERNCWLETTMGVPHVFEIHRTQESDQRLREIGQSLRSETRAILRRCDLLEERSNRLVQMADLILERQPDWNEAMVITATLDIRAVQDRYKFLVARHDSLRTGVQWLSEATEFHLERNGWLQRRRWWQQQQLACLTDTMRWQREVGDTLQTTNDWLHTRNVWLQNQMDEMDNA
ncbi:hypothetical protein FN846DRAFT_906383 [Sphaerosporella brunnea]|uniref:Uncharacterized protein n=1 Tax=Sphaerosporella brunnea TaxID=1250544 RepID=A0A5J5EYI6_9PEZI|nr:hypothetical protein FN846DRAFT_906383 [Sphaerosporella brunnea]